MKVYASHLAARPGRLAWKLVAGVMFGFVLMAAPAFAETSCPAVPLSQPFSSLGDLNYYALAPNGDFSNAAGGGWQLSGGAQIVKTTLPNGTSGNALSVPHGAKAVSPAMCIDQTYAYVRTFLKAVSSSPGLSITAVAAGHSQSQTIKGSAAWSAPAGVNVLPSGLTGAVQAQFVLQSTGSIGSNLVYDFYVDPRHR